MTRHSNWNHVGDKLDDATSLASKIDDGYGSVEPTVQNLISSSKTGKQLEETAHAFIYGIPDFIEMFEEVGKVVPFLGRKYHIFIPVARISENISFVSRCFGILYCLQS